MDDKLLHRISRRVGFDENWALKKAIEMSTLKRSLRRTEAFLEDSRLVSISKQNEVVALEKERKLLIDVAYKAIAAGEKVAMYSDESLNKEVGLKVFIELRTQLNDIEIPF